MSYVLAIDYGTSFTSAAIAVDGGRPEPLEIEGSYRFPSHVFLGEDGQFLVGRAAENSAAVAPERFLRAPKRELGERIVLLGGQSRPVVEAVAAILSVVVTEAQRRQGGEAPAEVRLTHPASWVGDRRMEALAEAGRLVGITAPRFIAEPEGAAHHFADERVTPGSYVAVYDLGGGTFDTAVMRRLDDGRFELAGPPSGRDGMGGEEFDLRLYRHLGDQLARDDPEGWQTFEHSDERKHRQARRAFLSDVRTAKETLSKLNAADLWVGDPINRDVRVYRHEFEHLIDDEIKQSVAILERTIAAAGLERSNLAGLYLTGGSSRIPLVHNQVQARFGQASMRDDPKTVVALGAAGSLGQAAAQEPLCRRPPAISGRAQVGETLVATGGEWAPEADVTLQWLRSSAPGAAERQWEAIPGASGDRYRVTEEDVGRAFTVGAVGRAQGREETIYSQATGIVQQPAPRREWVGTGGTQRRPETEHKAPPPDGPWWKKGPAIAAAVVVALLIATGVAAAAGVFDGGGGGSGDGGGDGGDEQPLDSDGDGTADTEDPCPDDPADACDDSSSSTGDPDEDELRSYIPSDVEPSCSTSDDATETAAAEVKCDVSGADVLYYTLFDSADDMNAYYDDSEHGQLADGDCATEDEVAGTWNYEGSSGEVGLLKCYTNSDSNPTIEATHDELLVYMYMVGSNSSDLYDAWSAAVPAE